MENYEYGAFKNGMNFRFIKKIHKAIILPQKMCLIFEMIKTMTVFESFYDKNTDL